MRTRYAWGIPGELGLLEIKNSLIQNPFISKRIARWSFPIRAALAVEKWSKARSADGGKYHPFIVRFTGVIVAISASKGRPVGGCPRCSLIGVGDRLSLDGRCGTPELFPLHATGLFASRQWVPLVQMRF
jgi:hypothetical protein